MQSQAINLYIDPSYAVYYKNKLFQITDNNFNRDGSLMPFYRLYQTCIATEKTMNTADFLLNQNSTEYLNYYYSLGILKNYKRLAERPDTKLKAFLVMEPPAVAPHLYKALPKLTKYFERVYVHNTTGDGYSLKGVDTTKLRTFYWPQPYENVLENYWHNSTRRKRIVVINGNHIPRSLHNELYSKRIHAMVTLAKSNMVDLYGRGWNEWWSHRSMWPPYWFNYKTLMSIYKGACDSKYEILSQYTFCLCFENMTMQGYVTEKIFDCFYAGTIPLYLGAKNIEHLIPSDSFVDCRKFSSWEEMLNAVNNMTDIEIAHMREAGRVFLASKDYLKYYDSLINIFEDH